MSEDSIPSFDDFYNPTIQALHDLGGSGTNLEIHDQVASILQLTDEQIQTPLKAGSNRRKVDFRLGWAKTQLKTYGLLKNSRRGVWALTPEGQNTTEVNASDLRLKVKAILKQREEQERESPPTDNADDIEDPDVKSYDKDAEWRDKLLAALKKMDPTAFERLCQRILRESGFTQVEVTGRSGDGGLDGIGVMRIGGFLSFKVLFQCKRHKGSIGASVIRDFRGAMVGRTDKGLIVTTGSFTPAATREATRDGAPEIDLVDGEQLIEKLKELELGVRTEQVTVERVVIDREWFGGV